MKSHPIIKTAGALSYILVLGSSPALQAGIQHISASPKSAKGGIEPMESIPAPRECDGCVEPGFYLTASLLYLHSYNSEENDYRGEWDAGARGSVGWASPSGLLFELTGFRHETDFTSDLGAALGNLEFYYVDLTVGDSIQCGEFCLSYSGGIRYGGNEFSENRAGVVDVSEFDGIGPVIAIGASVSLTEHIGLYATLRQSLLFGEDVFEDGLGGRFPTDTLTGITEIGVGAQCNFGLGGIDAFLRAGVEGQYWLEDGGNIGLFGGVLSVGSHF